MAVDTPVLERRTSELSRVNNVPFAVPTRSEYEAEDEHNARIKDNYARLINPNNRIEDVFNQNCTTPVQESAKVAQPVQAEPYLVKNARADAAIFRADNPINQRFVADAVIVNQTEEEESEDLRPTAATRQYRTVDLKDEEVETVQSDRVSMTKKQKTAIIVAIAIVVSLIVLIIINSTVIANLNADIAQLDSNIAIVNAEIKQSVSNISDILSNLQNNFSALNGTTSGLI